MTVPRLPPVAFDTERLWLEPLAPEHAPDLHALFSDDEALRYWHHPAVATLAETDRIVAAMIADNAATWVFGQHGSGTALGQTGFVNGLEPGGHAGFGYALRRDAWGHGLVVEASRAALAWGFTEVRVARAELWIHEDNVQSRRVAEKLGCSRRSETLHNHRGRPALRTIYGVTGEEWRGERERPRHFAVQPVLAVTDVNAAIGWWEDILGFRAAFAFGDPPTYGAVRPQPGWHGTPGIGLSRQPPARAGGSVVEVAVADVDAVAARARARGATILLAPVDYPWGQRQVELADPDGNHVRVVAPIIRP